MLDKRSSNEVMKRGINNNSRSVDILLVLSTPKLSFLLGVNDLHLLFYRSALKVKKRDLKFHL